VSIINVYLNPLDASSLESFEVDAGTLLIDFLQTNFPTGCGGCLRVFVGIEELALENLDYPVKEDEQITMLVMPGATIGAYIAANWVQILVQAAISAAIGYAISLIFAPSTPSFSQGEESPVYSINATRNRARLGEPIAAHYGTSSYPPDFAAAPYLFYNEGSNDMFVDELLCLGHGDFEDIEIYIGETPINDLEPGTVWHWIYGPDDHGSALGVIEADILTKMTDSAIPIAFKENVFTAPEVENWEFGHDAGEVVSTWAAISGTAVARGIYAPTGQPLPGRLISVPDTVDVAAGDTIELRNTTGNNVSFEVDAVVPGATAGKITIFERYKDDIISDEAPLNAASEYRVNSIASGMEAGPFRAQKLGQEIDGIDCDIIFPGGLYHISSSGNFRNKSVEMEFTFQQINEDTGAAIGAPSTVSKTFSAHSRTPYRATVNSGALTPGAYEVSVERITAILDDNNDTDTVAWSGLKGHVVLDTEAEAYGKVTLLAMRMKATNGLGQAARSRVRVTARRVLASGESENPITIIKDIWTNADYGMGKDVAGLDTTTLDALETDYDAVDGPLFNGSFDQRGTGFEGMQNVASMVAARVIQDNALVTVVPDRVQPVRTAMFSTANIIPDSLEIVYTFDAEGDFDGIKVEYRNPDNFTPEYVTYPSDSISPESFTLFGCTDGDYAAEYARYLDNVKRRRRKAVKLETELDGLIPRFGDRIGISHPMPDWGQSGVVVERISATEWRVDQALDWTGDDYIMLRDIDGSPTGKIAVTQGITKDRVVFASAPSISVYQSDEREPTNYTFGRQYLVIKDFIITKISPQSETSVIIEGQTYDVEIYTGAPAHMGGS